MPEPVLPLIQTTSQHNASLFAPSGLDSELSRVFAIHGISAASRCDHKVEGYRTLGPGISSRIYLRKALSIHARNFSLFLSNV